MRHSSLTAMLILSVASCGGDKGDATVQQSGATSAETKRATAAAAVANAIAAKPAAADSILKANGYTSESFQALMYDIASDSAMSVAYAAKKKK
jgi:hypothetical protein